LKAFKIAKSNNISCI